jgi:predicted RNase H-like HicB family nuclease
VATETRTFESVDASPEAKKANEAYFAEQGVTHEAKDDATPGQPATPPAAAPPASAAAPPAQASETVAEPEVVPDAETVAEWESDQTDGKRLSRTARKNQKTRALIEENERLKAELAAKTAKPDAAATPPASEPAPAPAAAESTAEAFTEAEPVEPKYEDFATEDDQLIAYNRALAKHTRELSRWDRRREAHEAKVAADKERRETAQAQEIQNARLTELNGKLDVIRKEFPDFDDVVQHGNALSQALQAASTVAPGGLKAAYLLAKDPAKLAEFNELTKETQKVKGRDVPTQDAYNLALYLLGQAAGLPAPASAAPPAAAIPSSSSQPREERPAPVPARGRAAGEQRREDLSGDARRDQLAAELGR